MNNDKEDYVMKIKIRSLAFDKDTLADTLDVMVKGKEGNQAVKMASLPILS